MPKKILTSNKKFCSTLFNQKMIWKIYQIIKNKKKIKYVFDKIPFFRIYFKLHL